MMKSSIGFAIVLLTAGALLEGCGGERVAAPMLPPGSEALSQPLAGSYKLLYLFQGGKDGSAPVAGLIELNGKLYGTTLDDGDMSCFHGLGCGTIFEVSLNGTHKVLHRFAGTPYDGAYPYAALVAVKGKLYGTTISGGATPTSVYGTVYELSTSGAEGVIHSFASSEDGQAPTDALVDDNGVLYGTTRYGGYGCYSHSSCGTVFSTSLSGKERVLHYFKSSVPPKDGVWPYAGLTLLNGRLYGLTGYGGTAGVGAFFEISTSGKEKVLYSFTGGHDGGYPFASLTVVNGKLYGTTGGGGALGLGTVFTISPSGKEHVIYSFQGSPNDGAGPGANVIAVNNQLYGTTLSGGAHSCYSNGIGCGTVFTMSLSGKEKVLHSFSGGKDGAIPWAGLVNVSGTLYGTTEYGGIDKCPAYSTPSGCGTIFAINP